MVKVNHKDFDFDTKEQESFWRKTEKSLCLILNIYCTLYPIHLLDLIEGIFLLHWLQRKL